MVEDTSLLVCKPEDMLTPEEAAATNSVIDTCETCKTKVWVVPRNLVLKQEKNAKITCWFCAAAITAIQKKGEEIVVLPAKPTVDEIEKSKQ